MTEEETRVTPTTTPMDDNDNTSVDSCSDDGTGAFGGYKKKQQQQHKKEVGGGVHFGSVRVRTHDLTLGDNPGGIVGIPLTLEWDPTDSTRYANVDDFATKFHGNATEEHHPAHRLEAKLRQQIAAEHHSAGSIRRVQMEVHEIRTERKKSSQEDPVAAEEKANKKSGSKKERHHGGGGFLQRFFKNLLLGR